MNRQYGRAHSPTYIAILCVVAALAGCGGTTTRTVTSTTTVSQPSRQPVPCPPGHSFAGCSSTGIPPGVHKLGLSPIGGPEFPDVSDWQGHPGWEQVKSWQQQHGWPAGGIFKIGEYGFDPDAAWNSARLSQLGMWKAGYWFVRATGCAHEAALIHQAAIMWGLKLVALDIEVPEAAGYSTCLVPALRPYIAHVIIYTGPGTWAGGEAYGSPLWDAAYNFSGPQFGGLWTGHAIAWQFTDGAFAAKTFVPGIGFDDVSVDLGGLSKLAQGGTPQPPPSTDPYAIMDHTKRHFVVRAYSPVFGAPEKVTASEYGTMTTAHRFKCHLGRTHPALPACRSSKTHLALLENRLLYVVHRYHGGSFNYDHARARHRIMSKALSKR